MWVEAHRLGDDLVDGLIGTLLIISVNNLTLSWDMPWEIGCGSVDWRSSSWPKSPHPHLPQYTLVRCGIAQNPPK